MSPKFLLTAFSKDRTGIVADISQVIFENGYNLEDSSMTYLAGEFAILLQLSAPANMDRDEVLASLTNECRRLEREKQITAFVRSINDEQAKPTNNSVVKTILVEGVDQAGIVYNVSKYLANEGANIRTLNSAIRMSPESGGALYEMTITVDIPNKLSLSVIENGLADIGDTLNVEITIS